MLLISLSAFVLLLCVDRSHSYYGYNFTPDNNRLPMCPLPSKPCRLRVIMRTFNGTLVDTSSNHLCTCSPPYQCSDDWANKHRRVISRRLTSSRTDMTLQMMFCQDVEPARYCVRREQETALVVRETMMMPTDVEAYNCRCPGRQPLRLRESGVDSNHNQYQKYMCANHMRYCANQSTLCMRGDETKTEFFCKCRRGTHCRPMPGSMTGTTPGYCRP